MQSSKETLEKAMNAATENELLFAEDAIAMSGVSLSTFYEKFPAKSEGMEALKEILTKNKIQTKMRLRKNWEIQEGNATMQLALYKLCSSNEEHKKLQQNYTDVKANIQALPPTLEPIDLNATDDNSSEDSDAE